MTQAINTLVIAALNAAHSYGATIAKLQTQLRGQDVSEIRTTLLPYVAGYYKVAIVEGTRGDRLDDQAPKYEAAKKALQRMTKDIAGTAVRQAAEPAKLTRAQLALIKACHDAGVTMKMFGQGVAALK